MGASQIEDDSLEYYPLRERHLVVKSQADFAPFLAKNFPRIWRTNPPPADTAGHRMLRKIIEQALALIRQRNEQEWTLFRTEILVGATGSALLLRCREIDFHNVLGVR